MSTVVTAGPRTAAQPRGSLLRAEAHRLRSRRLVRGLVAAGLLALVAGVLFATTQFARPSAAGFADAEQRRQAQVVQQRTFRDACLTSSPDARPPGVSPEDFCGPETTPDQFGSVESYLDKRPFALARHGLSGAAGVGGITAALAFLLGATYVGAEWSTRSMVALLFWEPRRPKVVMTKLAVLGAAVAALGVLAEAGWLLGARLLHGLRSDPAAALPPHTWGDLVAGAGRGALLVVLVGLLGFGVANLLRSTAAALGLGFVYFAVVENVARALRPHWQPYLLTDNAGALLTKGGLKIFYDERFVDRQGVFQDGGREHVLSNLHGAVVLAVVVAAVVGLGVLLFTRRDLD